ncbi:hypothetical protein [Lacrimispora amygdalina]|uniref:hypothetical protein n=1 Tax=Lacrimispora amygdalina TaxID=253257 RepID=UPI0031F9CCE7
MNTSTAINIFLKQVIRSDGIPFTVQADPFIRRRIRLICWQQKKEWKKVKEKFMISLRRTNEKNMR